MKINKFKQLCKPIYSLFIKSVLPLYLPFVSQKLNTDAKQAREHLEKISPDHKGRIEANNQITPNYDLHIIIPCYNVEKYVQDCLESVFEQKTKFSYFVTIINDGSSDHTLDIIQKVLSTQPNSILRHVELVNQSNKGFSGARNTGLTHIQGKYVMFVDSDDLLTLNAVEDLLQAAYKHQAAIAEGGYYTIDTSNHIIGKTRISHNRFFGQPWAKVFKATCFEHLQFPEGYLFEDSIMACCLFSQYKKVNVSAFVYQYRLNPSGITANHQKLKKSVDIFYLLPYLWNWMNKKNLITNVTTIKTIFNQAALAYMRTSHIIKDDSGFSLLVESVRTMNIKPYLKGLPWKYQQMFSAFEKNDFGKWKILSKYWQFL